ncbi:MAG: MmcQ/YjbR family DNA-binding protein [Ktedonobacterales bacterium]|nr:MmcQ/YjbR family DNA-binding protein [Ktedonobacterales bacterium]
MDDTQPTDPRSHHLTQLCNTLPETSQAAMGQHVRFLVREKSFAYFLNDHHGDGRVALCCKVAAGLNTLMAKDDPTRFFLPAYLGKNGWVGLRLDGADIDWDEVTALLSESYCLVAPKRLAALVRPPEARPPGQPSGL